MSYEPTNWKAGDTVTSAKLNKIEQGISSNGPLVVHISYDDDNDNAMIVDKTWKEIRDAAPNVYFVQEEDYFLYNYILLEIHPGVSGKITRLPSITLLSPQDGAMVFEATDQLSYPTFTPEEQEQEL